MSAPKHEWAVGDRAEVIGHQTQAQGTVVEFRKARYSVRVQFPAPHDDYPYWYAPGQLKFLGRDTPTEKTLTAEEWDTLPPYPDSIVIQNPRPENPKALPRHEQVTAVKDASAGGLSGEYIHEWVGQLSLRSADRLIQALHVAGYELVKK